MDTRFVLSSLLVVSALGGLTACSEPMVGELLERPESEDVDTRASFASFDSPAEYEAYMTALAQAYANPDPNVSDDPSANNDFGVDPAPEPEPDFAPDESGDVENEDITNNQEEGVDEGGIVKNIGPHLVVMRQGRLYAARVDDPGNPVQTDSLRIAANDALNRDVWYDEMLVKGNQIIIVGFRYITRVEGEVGEWGLGATEVSRFTLTDEGRIERGETFYLESNDYYDPSNYASRLAEGKMIFYIPSPVFTWDHEQDEDRQRVPTRLQHVEGDLFRRGEPLVTWDTVVAPTEVDPGAHIYHTVISCELPEGETADCRSRSMLGRWASTFYVSRSDVYVWTPTQVYQINQKTLDVRTHAVRGSVADQLSFKATDETLHVVVSTFDLIDEETEHFEQRLEVLNLALANFDNVGQQEIDSHPVADFDGYYWRARYTDGHFLITSEDWDGDDLVQSLRAIDLGDGTVSDFDLPSEHWVLRLESLPGIGGLIVTGGFNETALHVLRLGESPELEEPLYLEGVNQSESRSHGFFFKRDDQGGKMALPVLSSGEGGWFDSVSNIAFFDTDPNGELSMLGTISSSPEAEGLCETSCTDWYGNTRPIFLSHGTFALMGSEIVQIDIGDEGVDQLGQRLLLTF